VIVPLGEGITFSATGGMVTGAVCEIEELKISSGGAPANSHIKGLDHEEQKTFILTEKLFQYD
jgi:hypothetical protein